MKNRAFAPIVFGLLLSSFFMAGCSGVLVHTENPPRTIIGFSFITDRQIGEMDIKTPEGGQFKLSDSKSEQSKAIEAIKVAFDIMKWLIP